VSGNKMKATVSIRAANAAVLQGGNVKIRGTGPDGYVFPAKAAAVDDATATAVGIECAKAFPPAVGYFESLDIKWEAAFDDGPWFAVGTSRNQLYVSLGAPPPGMKCYHTVVHTGCTAAAGKTTPDAVFDAIWAKFKTLDIRRVKEPATPMTYWKNINVILGLESFSDFLEKGDGSCGYWSYFFLFTLQTQGITDCHKVGWWLKPYVLQYVLNGVPQEITFPRPDATNLGRMFVKNWRWGEANQPAGMPAQGNETPTVKVFFDHVVTRRGSSIYDPAYGTPPSASLIAWQSMSLDYVWYRIPLPPNNTPVDLLYPSDQMNQREYLEEWSPPGSP
jgi:hypothetical protein